VVIDRERPSRVRRHVVAVPVVSVLASSLSGIPFPYLTGLIVDRFSYMPVFFMASLMPLVGILILFGALGDYKRVPL
jgi:hypothetical protein